MKKLIKNIFFLGTSFLTMTLRHQGIHFQHSKYDVPRNSEGVEHEKRDPINMLWKDVEYTS
jgi:hypothetical protein